MRQTLTFRCARKAVLLEEYPLAAFDGRSATTVKLRGQDRVAFQAQHGATLQVDVLRNDCDVSPALCYYFYLHYTRSSATEQSC